MGALVEVRNIGKHYTVGRQKQWAVRDVTFEIGSEECLGLVGGSGCGKSTLAGIITSLVGADTGEILMAGEAVSAFSGNKSPNKPSVVQMVFQSPVESFNPRLTLGESITEGLINKGISKSKSRQTAVEFLQLCGLPKSIAHRYPHQVSGGECQRASIARAAAMLPKLLICDEATSALDVTIQAQVMELIAKLRRETKMSILLISHDIALIWELCDRMLVMNQGKIIEAGLPSEIVSNPKQDYTRELIEAAFLTSI